MRTAAAAARATAPRTEHEDRYERTDPPRILTALPSESSEHMLFRRFVIVGAMSPAAERELQLAATSTRPMTTTLPLLVSERLPMLRRWLAEIDPPRALALANEVHDLRRQLRALDTMPTITAKRRGVRLYNSIQRKRRDLVELRMHSPTADAARNGGAPPSRTSIECEYIECVIDVVDREMHERFGDRAPEKLTIRKAVYKALGRGRTGAERDWLSRRERNQVV